MVPSTPLHRPVGFFSDPPRWRWSPTVAVGLAFVTGLVLAITIYWLGGVIADQFGGTVTVDNPAYPGGPFCEGPGADAFSERPESMGDPCDEPAQFERDPEPYVQEAVAEVTFFAFVGWMLTWAVGAILLHVGAKVADGRGAMRQTFAIAAWSGVPVVLTSLPAAVVLANRFRSVELTLEDPDASRQAIESAVAPVEPILLAFTVIGTIWQAAIWYGGLRGLHDVDRGPAAIVAGVFWVVTVLLSL
jgi:hypothetical protein